MVEEICSHREAQLLFQLSELGIPVFEGHGSFVDPYSVEVESELGERTVVKANHFVLATGSRPRCHPTVQVDGQKIITSDHISDVRLQQRGVWCH